MNRDIDLGGLRLSLRDAAVSIARGVLAVRRGDRLAAESHLVEAQRVVAVADREVLAVARDARAT